MSKEIYISSTPHETRLAIVEDEGLTEIYYERENEYTLAGSIYNGKVTRVLPGMQSSFVDIGLERDAFLYITDFMEEAGDSADFDTSGEGHRSHNGEGRRDNRNVNREALPEGTSAAGPEASPERSDRGRDRGGRGRRDRSRSGNRDRQPVDNGQPQDSSEAVHTDFVADSIPIERTDSGDVGEGAPGADGTRRWRGRRGRRRGRGPGQTEQRDEASQTTSADSQSASASDETGDAHYDDSFDIDGAAAPSPVSNDTAPIPSAYPAAEATEHAEENSGRRDRNDRGDRNDRRGRGDRGRDQRPPRVPRGFAPKTSLYGVNDSSTYEETAVDGPAAEPFLLPGESLSKYRKPDEQTAANTSAAAAKPVDANIIIPAAPEFSIPSGWDGGATLPGESLSRHRRSEPREATRSIQAEPKLVAPVDYEPVEASASYRVDPAAPSEFRQSAPVLEAPEEVQSAAHVDEAYQEHHDPAAPNPTHTITPEPDQPVAQLNVHQTAAPTYEKFDWQTEAASASHELTAVHATGEMFTEPPAAAFIPQETTEPASPIQHETAIAQSPEVEPLYEEIAAVPHFAPGGEFAEETLDEEDFSTTLHASSIEEMDDLDEEETLEGAADLGTMLREMSIDEITRSGSEEDEEDDLEEEDAIHDPIHDLDDTDDEEDDEELDESLSEEDGLQEEFTEDGEVVHANGADHALVDDATTSPRRTRDIERRSSRREGGRRDGRRGDRGGRHDRSRHTGGAGDRERSSGGRDHRGGRSSMQSTDLPAISELLKPGQEILVQIAKEPIAKKGARITSHIALPGRFLVFMPTVNHTGVSRKIDSDGERRRLKEILLSEKGEASGGFIVRTAAEGASEEELRSDLRFLLNLWADIKQRSESSKSPALIYHDLNLVERILRDQVTDNFSAIWVDTETDYERILRFLQRFQPSLIRRVKLYTKETPLFEQFGITEEINKALRSKVWLKSGGSIVINQTEALVAIDINTGKFVGKTARLEDTIVKTNLDAIPEIVRQIRLRDLGGIIIIDFIDMDERKNRNKVMAALEEELKNDRAPSKVLQFNDFGLVAITRKRVKQSLERTLSTTCGVCQGTGMVKSPVTVCNDIYIEMRKMHKHLDRGDVMLRVNPEVVKQLKAPGTKWLQEMEEMVGKTILVKSDPALHPEQFDIH
jgi:ribonuclease E